ncbi:MAG: hypothetical protein LBL43_05865 [Treponema sp.]|nr:hypothetical protein [Treponema sp.]
MKDSSEAYKYEIFDNVYIEHGKLDIEIVYNIDWPPMINIIDDYLKGFKEKENIKNKISNLNITNVKHGKIIMDKDHHITSSFSCINKNNQTQKIEFGKSKIKQVINNYENLPFVRGEKYTKHGDFGIRGNALRKHSAIFKNMRLVFFGLSNEFENHLHINGFILDYKDSAKDFPCDHVFDHVDEHFFGRMDNTDHWTYLGKCNTRERYSERQLIHYFLC